MYQGPDGGWQGGTSSEVVAGNAKNATPISVVAYLDTSGSTNVTVVSILMCTHTLRSSSDFHY